MKKLLPPLIFIRAVRELGISVRKVEQTPTGSGDTPISPCVITACGQLQPDDPSLATSEGGADAFGDRYEDFPEDEERVEVSEPDVALQVDRSRLFDRKGH